MLRVRNEAIEHIAVLMMITRAKAMLTQSEIEAMDTQWCISPSLTPLKATCEADTDTGTTRFDASLDLGSIIDSGSSQKVLAKSLGSQPV